MAEKKGEGIEIVMSDQVKSAMEADSELAAAMREMFANMRQAQHAVDEGRYPTFEDALEAITGKRPTPATFEDC